MLFLPNCHNDTESCWTCVSVQNTKIQGHVHRNWCHLWQKNQPEKLLAITPLMLLWHSCISICHFIDLLQHMVVTLICSIKTICNFWTPIHLNSFFTIRSEQLKVFRILGRHCSDLTERQGVSYHRQTTVCSTFSVLQQRKHKSSASPWEDDRFGSWRANNAESNFMSWELQLHDLAVVF